MRVLGIDPGPKGVAWAIYDAWAKECDDPPLKFGDIVEWGTSEGSVEGLAGLVFDAVGIEDIHSYGRPMSNDVRDTAVTIGHVEQWLWDRPHSFNKQIIRLSRKTIAAAITRNAKSGDVQINAVMAKLCPALNGKRKGLNGHHRAAAAVALVAAGRIRV